MHDAGEESHGECQLAALPPPTSRGAARLAPPHLMFAFAYKRLDRDKYSTKSLFPSGKTKLLKEGIDELEMNRLLHFQVAVNPGSRICE